MRLASRDGACASGKPSVRAGLRKARRGEAARWNGEARDEVDRARRRCGRGQRVSRRWGGGWALRPAIRSLGGRPERGAAFGSMRKAAITTTRQEGVRRSARMVEQGGRDQGLSTPRGDGKAARRSAGIGWQGKQPTGHGARQWCFSGGLYHVPCAPRGRMTRAAALIGVLGRCPTDAFPTPTALMRGCICTDIDQRPDSGGFGRVGNRIYGCDACWRLHGTSRRYAARHRALLRARSCRAAPAELPRSTTRGSADCLGSPNQTDRSRRFVRNAIAAGNSSNPR